MELKKIKQILQKYWEGETTEQEERVLTDYFKSDNIAPELKQEQSFFNGLFEFAAEERDEALEDDIMDHILEQEHREKTHYRWLWQTVSGIAAALMIAILAVNLTSNQKPWQDTYSNPDQAYTAASNTLQYVAGYYQKGIEELQPVKTLNKASQPLSKGLNKIEKGFQEIQEVEKINEKLKKQ
ncbi:hypothetical protein [Sunxiuqinia sp. sy24]|uniref:hypothetical protein n=1 Tax=Sunxiuqinia sp. sy24 TaxID=3461495 RepID=UPI004045AEF1